MALTDQQKAKIRRFLGYPDIFRYKNTRLEGVLQSGTISAEVETLIVADIAKLDALDDALTSTGGTAIGGAGVKKVDEIEFFGSGQTITDLRNIGRMLVGRISTALGVPTFADFFSPAGYPGDFYSELGGMGRPNRNGGPIGLG